MTKKLSEIVSLTQQIEQEFEEIAPWLLERLAKADPAKDDLSIVRLYGHCVQAVGGTCDELIRTRENS